MINGTLYRRLRNWGEWLNYEAEIAPADARCVSLESRYIAEAGEVWDPSEPRSIPDVIDAEAMQAMVRTLDVIEQYALAVRYGGMPCVMRFRRMSGVVHDKMADNAERALEAMLKKTLATAA